jgi:hypothetical protein
MGVAITETFFAKPIQRGTAVIESADVIESFEESSSTTVTVDVINAFEDSVTAMAARGPRGTAAIGAARVTVVLLGKSVKNNDAYTWVRIRVGVREGVRYGLGVALLVYHWNRDWS